MTTSVIIPTYNGAHKIMGVIRSLENQTWMPDEIIVVIDGSTDGTAEMLRKQSIYLPSFKIIEQKNGGRAAVRNRGAREAQSQLLIFLDDDMEALPELIASHQRHHMLLDNVIITGKLLDPNKNSPNDFLRFKHYLNERWTPKESIGEDLIQLGHIYLTAGNLSIKKKDFNSICGFDELLNDAEDYDLGMRAYKKGFKLMYSSIAVAIHNDQGSDTCAKYINRLIQYQYSHSELSERKPDLYGKATAYKNILPKGIKGMIFNIFKNSLWVKAVDKKLLKWMPKKLRFKIYDIIVTANTTL